ncbi:MAG: hypothetical protein U1E27_10925 [Kiritimatiellia bacterium]|nr:hypothetical protein [Kiritimatiellia bacterium]
MKQRTVCKVGLFLVLFLGPGLGRDADRVFAQAASGRTPQAPRLKTRYVPSDLPQVAYRSPGAFYPFAWRFGTTENEIAFFLFDARRKEDKIPDTLYLYIPGHPQYNEPQTIRGRVEDKVGVFRRIALTRQLDGMTQEMTMDVQRTSGEDGHITLEVALTGVRGAVRSTVLHGLPRMGLYRNDHGRGKDPNLRIIDFTDQPELTVRAFEDGTRIACTLTRGRDGKKGIWYLLPQQGADSDITVEIFDDKGALAETLKLKCSPSDYMANDAWSGRLRKLEKDKTYTVRARINLGALYGELKAETITMLRDMKF